MFRRLNLLVLIAVLVLSSGLVSAFLTEGKTDLTGNIIYQLDWIWGAATPSQNGWDVTNDLGYHIHVDEAYLVSYSVQLVECEQDHEETASSLDLFGIQTAYAGHGSDAPDPSSLVEPTVESFAAPEMLVYGSIAVPAATYCQAHYLVARAGNTTANLPNQIELMGTSVYIAGTVRYPDKMISTSFVIETTLANGTVMALPSQVDISETATIIVISRDLGTLFNGVDFATMDADAQGQAVLWSLIAHTQVSIAD